MLLVEQDLWLCCGPPWRLAYMQVSFLSEVSTKKTWRSIEKNQRRSLKTKAVIRRWLPRMMTCLMLVSQIIFPSDLSLPPQKMASLGKSFIEKPERVIHNNTFELPGSTKVNSEPSQDTNQSVICHIELSACNFPTSHKSAPEKFDQLSSRISRVEKYLEDIASYM